METKNQPVLKRYDVLTLISMYFVICCTACLELELRKLTSMDMESAVDQDTDLSSTDILDVGKLDLDISDMQVGNIDNDRCGDGIVSATEQCDDGNSDSNDGCSADCEIEPDECNGRDDNDNGRVDEELFAAPTSITIVFSETTGVDASHGSISILDRKEEHISGSPFTGSELRGQTLTIQDNGFLIRIELNEEAQATSGYLIEQITDQDGRIIPGPYPSLALNDEGKTPIPLYDQQRFSKGDSTRAGEWCGDHVGKCQSGILSCVGGTLFCDDGTEASVEECNLEDDDCDGQVDEMTGVELRLCAMQQGVCSGLEEICDNGEWRCPYEELIDYQVVEASCDCLDNDCDGHIDQTGDQDLGCSFSDVLASSDSDRDCIVQVDSEVTSGSYRFGSLTIAENVELSVIPSGRTDVGEFTCGGFQGLNNCALGGGCFLLSAAKVEVHGRINANAAGVISSVDESLCGGSSGGDIQIEADEFVLHGTLEANGADGWQAERANSSAGTGGGAGGSIKIKARRIQFTDDAVIRSWGGRGSDPNNPVINAARGAGSGGGANGGAGAGSGALSGNAGNDNPERGVALIGELFGATVDQLQIGLYDGSQTGYLDLGGSALSLSSQLSSLFIREFPLVIHILEPNGQALSEQRVAITNQFGENVINLDDSASNDEVLRTDGLGWLSVDQSTFTASLNEEYEFSLPDAENASGNVFFSYYDVMNQSSCSEVVFFENGGTNLGSFTNCN